MPAQDYTVYLGKDLKSSTYFFLSRKQGLNRFIKFVTYPMWVGAKHLVDFLDPQTVPEGVFEDVIKFVDGKIEFEVTPKKKGRPEVVERVEIPQPIINVVTGDHNGSNSSIGERASSDSLSSVPTSTPVLKEGKTKKGEKASTSNPSNVAIRTKRTGTELVNWPFPVPVRNSAGGHNSTGSIPETVGVGTINSSPVTKPGTRRKPEPRVLGSSGGESGIGLPHVVSTPTGRATDVSPVTSLSSDASGGGSVGSDVLKVKRKRRTKAEMAALLATSLAIKI